MESQLLLGTPPQTNDASTKSASLAELVLKGEYSQVLKSKIAEDVLRKPDIDASTLEAGGASLHSQKPPKKNFTYLIYRFLF